MFDSMDAKKYQGANRASVAAENSPVAWLTHPGFTLPADSADFRGLVVDHIKEEFGALVEICGSLRATVSQK